MGSVAYYPEIKSEITVQGGSISIFDTFTTSLINCEVYAVKAPLYSFRQLQILPRRVDINSKLSFKKLAKVDSPPLKFICCAAGETDVAGPKILYFDPTGTQTSLHQPVRGTCTENELPREY